MRYLLAFILSVSAIFAQAQQVNPVTDYTFANRMSSGRSTVTDTAAYFSIGPRYGAVRGMMPPMVTDTVSMSANKRNGLLIFSIQKNKYQVWDSAGAKWADITGAAGSAIISADTAAMLLPYLRKADTTAMLLPYLRKSDTLWLSNRINLKLNISDTSSMLNPYLRGSGTANYFPKFDASRSVINSKLYESGTNLLFNTTNPSFTSAGITTIENNATSSAVYTYKIADTIRAYMGYGGSSTFDINNLRAGDIRFYTNAQLRGRFQTDGTFRLNSLTGTGSRIVTADADGVLSATSSATGLVDTTVLSTRAWRQKGIDSVNANVALKVNISDTASMLTNYIRHAGNGLTKSGQALSVDTASIATRARVQKGIDSVATLASAGVTSVATGYGLSGGTITTTGTIIVDSAIVASRLRVGKVVDSLALVKQNVLTNPVTGTGTTNYVTKFTGTSTIGNSTIVDNGNVGIGQTNPLSSLEIGNGTGLRQVYVNGGGYDLVIGASGGPIFGFTSQNISAIFNTSADPLGVGTNASQPLILGTAATERMRIDATGKVGVNVTPSAWSWDVLQVGRGSISNTSSIMTLGANVFYDGAYKYIATGTATAIEQNSFGAIKFLQASSGSAGGTATMNEVLTMNSNAELLLNTTTDAGDYKLQVSGNAYVTGTTVLAATGGNVGVGTESPVRKLHVNGNQLFENTNQLNWKNTSGSLDAAKIMLFSDNNMYFDNPDGAHIFRNASFVETMRATSARELLIRTTTDAGDYALQVSGNAYVTGTTVLAATGGTVGVGTTVTTEKFNVGGAGNFLAASGGSTTGLAVLMTNATDNIDNGVRLAWKQNGATYETAYITALRTGANAYTSLVFATTASGWNSAAPTEKIRIHANGGLKFVGQSAAPTAEAGTVYYDTDDNKLKVYNGTTWVDLH